MITLGPLSTKNNNKKILQQLQLFSVDFFPAIIMERTPSNSMISILAHSNIEPAKQTTHLGGPT